MYKIKYSQIHKMYRVYKNNVVLPMFFPTLEKAQQYVNRRTNK